MFRAGLSVKSWGGDVAAAKAVFICAIKGQRHPPSRCAEGGDVSPPAPSPRGDGAKAWIFNIASLFAVAGTHPLHRQSCFHTRQRRQQTPVEGKDGLIANVGKCFSCRDAVSSTRERGESPSFASLDSLCDVTKGSPTSARLATTSRFSSPPKNVQGHDIIVVTVLLQQESWSGALFQGQQIRCFPGTNGGFSMTNYVKLLRSHGSAAWDLQKRFLNDIHSWFFPRRESDEGTDWSLM